MKKILTTIALSLSALIATSAMAGNDHRYEAYQHQNAAHIKYNNYYDQKHGYNNHRWQKGQILPREYSKARFQVSDREARRLPQHGRYQQWYKVNGDYLLVNERTNRIIRIMG